ncbi:MAG: sigma 54-interacting transcriptional regulator, partial [Planctomycetota bacterium]
RAIHQLSGRHAGPFVEVACGALPDNLLEAELFGHVKGAFTGADRDREGRLAAAEGGTLFLDEINSAPLAMQVKLLRVLQERIYEPLGSNKPARADVRFVVASNADLGELVQAGQFREDLFYRINVVSLELPPLRDRAGDVPLLADHFLGRFKERLGRDLAGFTPGAVDALGRYDWPGNIRELENAIERAAVLCRSLDIDVDDLPEPIRAAALHQPPMLDVSADLEKVLDLPLKDAMEALERPVLLAALERHDWSRQKTAAALGINRATLFKKMRRFKLDVPA